MQRTLSKTLEQQIDDAVYKHDRGDLAEVIMGIIDSSDHMTIQELDAIARTGTPVKYRGEEYIIRRMGYEYSEHDCDKVPYVELLDCKTKRCAVYAEISRIEV